MPCIKEDNAERRHSKELDKKVKQWAQQYSKAVKILLLGTGESGKTTIIKQMKILHISGFSDSERREKVKEIRHNVHDSIYNLLENMTKLNPPAELDDEESEKSGKYIRDLGPDGPEQYTEEYFHHVQVLWSDYGIQETYRHRNEFQLIDSAKYFLDKISQVSQPGYNPTDQDILHSRRKTTAIQKIEFTMKVPASYGGGLQEFWMFDVGGQRIYRSKWIQAFEGIQAILFIVAASDYNHKLREDETVNRLREALDVFHDIWHSKFLKSAGCIIFFNKQDILEQKINANERIEPYFPEYKDYKLKPKDGNEFDELLRAKCFIRDLFLNETKRPDPNTRQNRLSQSHSVIEDTTRKCYHHFTTATNTKNIRTVFDDVHVMIIEMNLKDIGIIS